MNVRCFALATAAALSIGSLFAQTSPSPAAAYREPAWVPRIHPTLDDITGGFHPPSPPVKVDYDAPGFAEDRLSAVPEAGVHPRVLLSPSDIATLRARVRQGDAAPAEFVALWKRVSDSRSPLYALIMEDSMLGLALARDFVQKVAKLETKLDIIDAQPDAGHIWSVERSLVASGDPEPPHEIWSLLDYDYLHHWMTDEERALTQKVLARIVRGRISNYLAEPDHFIINNHKGFGMEFIRLMLLIEGTPDFPEATFRASVKKARAMLDWYLSPDGMCFESIKGWLNTSAFVAVARRERDILRHDHLIAKLRYFQATLRWESGHWQIRDEMRASAFHVIWLMRYFYPENPVYDLLYHASLASHPFLTDTSARWPDPVGISAELLLLFAGGGDGLAGKRLDWTTQEAVDTLRLPLTWKDDLRGYLEARNSWKIGDLHLGFVNKQDFYYGGHEGSEANRVVMWKDGVNWIKDENLLAIKATGLQNMLTVDGRGLAWPPVPGVWLGVNEGPHGISASGDARMAYTYRKVMQVHPLFFASAKLPYYAPFSERNFDLDRSLQVAFHPGTVAWNDGYAHTDYGPWSGETRLVEYYGTNNPMKQAYRTVHLARGSRPYVLLVDDAQKDDGQTHLFEASFNLPDNAVVLNARCPEIQFQNVEPSESRESEFLITSGPVSRDEKTGKPVIRKGDPMLLIRVLHRNSSYGYPVPRLQVLPGRPELSFQGFTQFVVPAISRSPEFRILFYPHRHGDPIPVCTWNEKHTELTVSLDNQVDVYRFDSTDGGQTVFNFSRNGVSGLEANARPARPIAFAGGDRVDTVDQRTTRFEGTVPQKLFGDRISVSFEHVSPPAFIRYTLDGSEPDEQSPVYSAPFEVSESCTLKACVVSPGWLSEKDTSEVLTVELVQKTPAAGEAAPPEGSQAGLLARVYEISTKMWDDKGFFRADLQMLPDLDAYTAISTQTVARMELPYVVPQAPIEQQCKGFYRFTGWFYANRAGAWAFEVNSCGPVLIKASESLALCHTGVFHQQQDVRTGAAVLGKGWHRLELIVTDPIFWNIATHDLMPFSFRVREPGSGQFRDFNGDELRSLPPSEGQNEALDIGLEILQPERPPMSLVPGLIRKSFERSGKSRAKDYLDVDGLKPLREEPVTEISANTNPNQALVYEGWFFAPFDGLYEFIAPARKQGSGGLGEFRRAFQNQIRLSGTVVAQRGIAGRFKDGRVMLTKGWYPLSLHMGSSQANFSVVLPDGQRVSLDGHLLYTPATVSVTTAGGDVISRNILEIYEPTDVILRVPRGIDGEIHYTLDGSEPSAESPVFRDFLKLESGGVLKSVVIRDGKPVTATGVLEVRMEEKPRLDEIARVDFTNWDGTTGIIPLDERCRIWFGASAKRDLVKGRNALTFTDEVREIAPGAVDRNLTRSIRTLPIKIQQMKLNDPEFSVSLWFLSESGHARLFGKDGLTAFGKSYRTISARLSNGKVFAGPGNFDCGKVSPSVWNHLVMTATPRRLTVYINGRRAAEAPGTVGLETDALDLLGDHSCSIADVAVFNRELAPKDVEYLYKSESLD